jgi:acetolactate synthase-1/2/3 large subunit
MSVDPLLTEEMSAIEALIRVLEEAGIDLVFGLSGGHTGRIVRALGAHQTSIRTILVRQESLAGPMAETYGRLTGRPGVIFGQGAFMMGYGLPGILEAHLSSSPMLVLTELSDQVPFSMHAPYQSGTGHYGGWNAEQAFRAISKEVFVAHEPVEVVIGAQLAIKHALAGQRGPVTLLLSGAALSGTVGPDTRPRLYPTPRYLCAQRPSAESVQIDEAADALEKAERPVVVVGNGVRISQAFDALAEFVEAFDLPVVTTAAGKGCFAETDSHALGVFGTYGLPAANACVAEADLVLVVGSKLGISDTAFENPSVLDPRRQVFIQIDIEERNAAWTWPVEHVLVGDAGVVLSQLQEATKTVTGGGHARVARYRQEYGYFDMPEYTSDAKPLLPQRVIGELIRALPEDAVVTCDAGENRLFMMHFYQTKRAGGFLQAAGLGPMGNAIPSALAVKLIHPDLPVVAVCGDGGFAMTMNGLLTARQEGIPIIVVVLNNQYLGWSLHSRGGEDFATYLGDFDYAAIARGMGCRGIQVDDPKGLEDALHSALSESLPTVIDVATSLDTSYRDVEAKFS